MKIEREIECSRYKIQYYKFLAFQKKFITKPTRLIHKIGHMKLI